jgi:hypothetical protein
MTTSGVITNVYQLTGGDIACGPTCASLTAGPDGNIWFTQGESTPQIGRITVTGQITYFPLTGLHGAGDIVWGEDGNIWFAAVQDQLVGRISPHTTAMTFFSPVTNDRPSIFARLSNISSSPDGNIWFTGTQDVTGSLKGGVGKIVLNVPEDAVGRNITHTHRVTFTDQIGSFVDEEHLTGGYFDATLNWGDGTPLVRGKVVRTFKGSPNRYQVFGTHTYAKAGRYNVNVKITETGDKYKFNFSSQAIVH